MSVMPEPLSQNLSNGALLVALDGRVLALAGVDLSATARGGLASVRLQQRFRNPHDEPLTATYHLPLPADGAVVDFSFRIGDRVVKGEVDRRENARRRFEDAVLDGHTAALLEQDRTSLFRQEVGNIPPGADVLVEILIEQPLLWKDSAWEWRFPTVVAPRFLGSQTPDADRVTVPVADGPTPPRIGLALTIDDAVYGAPTSPSHPLSVHEHVVRLAGPSALDRDVVVRWAVAAPKPGLTVEVAREAGHEHAYALVTLVPPDPAHALPSVARDLILLIDTSGSMSGAPLRQAVAVATALVDELAPTDRLEMIEFSSSPRRWRKEPAAMGSAARADALAWLRGLRAHSSTMMHDAILEALRPLRAEAQRQVLLITDGLIGFEEQVVSAVRDRLPGGCRVHTLGVGSAVNRSLLGPVAQAGGGVEAIVGPDEDPRAAVAALVARTGRPVLVDLAVRGAALVQPADALPRDLFARAPCRLALCVDAAGGELVLHAHSADGPWQAVVQVPATAEGSGRRVVSTRYARARVEALELARTAGDPSTTDAEIERLGLGHRIATRRTSWVAVSSEPTVDPTRATRREVVPQQLPHGMSAEGVGLRAAGGLPVSYSAGPAPRPSLALGGPTAAYPAPQAPRSRSMKSAPARFIGSLIDAGRAFFEADEAEAPAPSAADAGTGAAPTGLPALVARVRRRRDGVLVVEVTVHAPLDWQPRTVVSMDAAGRRLQLVLAQPTTAEGLLQPGQVLRLAVRLPDSEPLPLTLGVEGPDGWLLLQVEEA